MHVLNSLVLYQKKKCFLKYIIRVSSRAGRRSKEDMMNPLWMTSRHFMKPIPTEKKQKPQRVVMFAKIQVKEKEKQRIHNRCVGNVMSLFASIRASRISYIKFVKVDNFNKLITVYLFLIKLPRIKLYNEKYKRVYMCVCIHE